MKGRTLESFIAAIILQTGAKISQEALDKAVRAIIKEMEKNE